MRKWNNLNGSAKSRADCNRRKARRTGGGPNEVKEREYDPWLREIVVYILGEENITYAFEYTKLHWTIYFSPQQHYLLKQRLLKHRSDK